MRYCMTPAPSRRATMPTARRIATPRKRAMTATSRPLPISASRKAGSTTWSVAQPRTQASATVSAPNSTLPSVDRAKMPRSRRIATQSTANPSRVVAPTGSCCASLTARPPRFLRPGQPTRLATLFPDADSTGILTSVLHRSSQGHGSALALVDGAYAPLMPGLPPLRASYVRNERQALCETARSVGPKAATLLEGWDVKDLICHLLVRESSVLGALGIALSPLSGLTEKEMARLKRQPFERLVERFRKNRFSFSALPPAD